MLVMMFALLLLLALLLILVPMLITQFETSPTACRSLSTSPKTKPCPGCTPISAAACR